MIRAVFFDLHGTIGYVVNPVTPIEVADFLASRGYEVSPQAWSAATRYVGMIDYPKLKFDNYTSYLRQVCLRLNIEVDEDTLIELVKVFERRDFYEMYPEAMDALRFVKEELELKTAIVTTIPEFKFKSIVEAASKYVGFVMTGAEAGCDKSNPKMYLKLLKILNLNPSNVVVLGDEEYVDVVLPEGLK